MRWIFLFSLFLLFSCGTIPIYTKKEKELFATCTAHLSDFKYHIGMAQKEVHSQLGTPARTFYAKENSTGQTVVIDEYREKGHYEDETGVKNLWGTPTTYLRQGCERTFIAYDLQNNLAIGKGTFRAGHDVGREFYLLCSPSYDPGKLCKFIEK